MKVNFKGDKDDHYNEVAAKYWMSRVENLYSNSNDKANAKSMGNPAVSTLLVTSSLSPKPCLELLLGGAYAFARHLCHPCRTYGYLPN